MLSPMPQQANNRPVNNLSLPSAHNPYQSMPVQYVDPGRQRYVNPTYI